MTIRHNNHYCCNVAFDGAVMVGGNYPPPRPHKVGFPEKQKHFTRSAVFLTFCPSNKELIFKQHFRRLH